MKVVFLMENLGGGDPNNRDACEASAVNGRVLEAVLAVHESQNDLEELIKLTETADGSRAERKTCPFVVDRLPSGWLLPFARCRLLPLQWRRIDY